MRYLLLTWSILCAATLPAQGLYFPSTTNSEWETLSLEEAGFRSENDQALYDFLEATNTNAFLLLKDGKIVIERYFGDFTSSSAQLWNSAGKSLMATAVGIAADLDSVDINAPVADYLGPGWTACPDTETDIKVIHQLTMTSGLDYSGLNFSCTDPECLLCQAAPGERWNYHNGPYTLLGEVIEAATGEDLNDFVTERIKRPTGMTGIFVYFGANRIFRSNARSMARFGLLTLNRGVWDGTPILADTDYFDAMTTSSQSLNPAYGYLWWLNGKASHLLPNSQDNLPGFLLPNAPAGTIAAAGKNGQLINVVPEQGLVMVRMGDDPEDGAAVPVAYNDSIWTYLNALTGTTATTGPVANDEELSVSPNPAREEVRLKTTGNLRRVSVFSGKGRRLHSQRFSGHSSRISLRGIAPGVVYLRIVLADGTVRWRRVVKV